MEKHRERYWELCLTHLRSREERVAQPQLALPVTHTRSQAHHNIPRSSLNRVSLGSYIPEYPCYTATHISFSQVIEVVCANAPTLEAIMRPDAGRRYTYLWQNDLFHTDWIFGYYNSFCILYTATV